MYLRPSEIRFSQDSIGRSFGCYTSHPYIPIGETLDDIITGRINVYSIPGISVCKRNGHWFTTDNRRLWVFQEAEKRGKCTEIYVQETFYIAINKITTINNGISVVVRGNPGGFRWKTMPVQKIQREFPKPIFPTTLQTSISSNHSVYQLHVDELDTKKVLLAKHEHNVQTTNGWPMPKLSDSPYIEREISRNVKNRPEDIETQYCIQDDYNSKLKNVNVQQLTDFSSSGFGVSQRQDNAPTRERIYLRTQIHSTETTFVTTMEEEKLSKIGKPVDEDDVFEVSEIITYPTNEALLKSNFVAIGQTMNRYSVHEDSDSENEGLKLELLDCSCSFNAYKAQDNVSNELQGISKSNSNDKNIDETKEEKMKEFKWDKQMIVESVANVFHVPCSDSENEGLKLELLDCSCSLNAYKAQDNVSNELQGISKSNSNDKNIDETKEEKMKEFKWDKQMIVESVANVFHVPKIPTNGNFQSSNSEEFSLMENMNATVTMAGLNILQPNKNTNTKSIMLSFICLLIFVGLFVILGIVINMKFT